MGALASDRVLRRVKKESVVSSESGTRSPPTTEFLPPSTAHVGPIVWLKLESGQLPGSLHIRGTDAACQEYSRRGATRFVSSSGGNAGIAVVWEASGCSGGHGRTGNHHRPGETTDEHCVEQDLTHPDSEVLDATVSSPVVEQSGDETAQPECPQACSAGRVRCGVRPKLHRYQARVPEDCEPHDREQDRHVQRSPRDDGGMKLVVDGHKVRIERREKGLESSHTAELSPHLPPPSEPSEPHPWRDAPRRSVVGCGPLEGVITEGSRPATRNVSCRLSLNCARS